MSWALITGASSGLGEQLARLRAAGGIPHLPELKGLILVARRREALGQLAGEITTRYPHVSVHVVAVDLSDSQAFREIEKTLSRNGISLGDITEVYSNAGVGTIGPFSASSRQEVESMLSVNVVAATTLLHAMMQEMERGLAENRDRRYRICLIASVASFTPGPLMAVYYASKAFTLSLGEALRREVGNRGIQVTVACPGPFQSAFHQNAGIRSSGPATAPAARVARAILRGAGKNRAIIPVGPAAWFWSIVGPRLPRLWAREVMYRIQTRRS